jgi:hypothetical protein
MIKRTEFGITARTYGELCEEITKHLDWCNAGQYSHLKITFYPSEYYQIKGTLTNHPE